MRISKCHTELTNGEGKCSVPMWCDGLPAGFCDRPAYGRKIPGKEYRDNTGQIRRFDGRYEGYVPGLACQMHGGPNVDSRDSD